VSTFTDLDSFLGVAAASAVEAAASSVSTFTARDSTAPDSLWRAAAPEGAARSSVSSFAVEGSTALDSSAGVSAAAAVGAAGASASTFTGPDSFCRVAAAAIPATPFVSPLASQNSSRWGAAAGDASAAVGGSTARANAAISLVDWPDSAGPDSARMRASRAWSFPGASDGRFCNCDSK
jgi:hypothetical protein